MHDFGSKSTTGEESTDEHTCCGPAESATTAADGSAGHWRPDGAGLDEPLPPALQSALGEFVGGESVETLWEWVTELRRQVGGGAISLDALCHSSEATEHWGTMDGQRYYFLCFYDAVIMAAIADEPVDIRTESPGGAVIEARSVGGVDLSVTPAEAVFSFGVDTDVVSDADEPTLEAGYEAICPYVKAFPDRDAYEAWAGTVDAPTIAMPLAGATEIAAALTA